MNVRTPPRRLLLEGLVIVVSILLAFGIEAWWGARLEREGIETALANLEAGFLEHIALIDAEVQRIEPFEDRVQFFLDATAADSSIDAYWLVLEAIHRPTVQPLNSDELIALLEAEALSELDAPDFWTASAAWRANWRVVLDRHDSLYELEDDALRALAQHAEARSVVAGSTPRESFGRAGLEEARRDPAVVPLAAVKAYHMRILRFLLAQMRERADSVLLQIQSERAR